MYLSIARRRKYEGWEVDADEKKEGRKRRKADQGGAGRMDEREKGVHTDGST